MVRDDFSSCLDREISIKTLEESELSLDMDIVGNAIEGNDVRILCYSMKAKSKKRSNGSEND